MAKPNTLADDEMSLHIDRVRIGRLPGSTKQEKKAASTSKQLLAESYIPLVKNIAEKYVHKLGRDEARSAAYYGLRGCARVRFHQHGIVTSTFSRVKG